MSMSNPSIKQIVVSVDTEEEGLWGGNYKVVGNTTHNLRGLERFQSECEKLSAPPTYLIDAPVLEDRQAIEQLSRWQRDQVCEVGAHCHAWCNPPITLGHVSSHQSYLCNLPQEVQRAKLTWLTERIAQSLGRSPTSYRAGRYGFDRVSAEILDDLGYVVDSSVLPLHDYSSKGGPNFLLESREPSRFFGLDSSRQLIEIPVTAGFVAGDYTRRRNLWIGLRKQPWQTLKLAGVADRLGITRRVKFSPEGTELSDLTRLVDSSHRSGLTTLVLMLHSSSLVVGLSPYSQDAEQLQKLYERLSSIIKYAIGEHGYRPVTLTQAAQNWRPCQKQNN
jgi:hypothetical protein